MVKKIIVFTFVMIGMCLCAISDGQEVKFWDTQSYTINSINIKIINGFNNPFGLSVNEQESIFVVDISNKNIVKFNKDLEHRSLRGKLFLNTDLSFNVKHEQNNSLKGPHSIAFDSKGIIYVADFVGKKINIYNNQGKYIGLLDESLRKFNLSFIGPSYVYIDIDDNIWVCDWSGHRVFKFTSDRTLVGWFGYTENGATNGFVKKGKSIKSNNLGGLNKPHMITLDNQNNIYVVESGSHRIQKFNSNAISLGWIGAYENGSVTNGWSLKGKSAISSLNGGFNSPVSIRTTQNNEFIITDNGNHRIQLFNKDGKFIGWVGGTVSEVYTSWTKSKERSKQGERPGFFKYPYDAILLHNRLYVADGHNKRVQIISSK